MTQNQAATIPKVPWNDGPADVIPLPGTDIKTVVLKNFPYGAVRINKNQYPAGVVIMTPAPPAGNYAILPLRISDKTEETITTGPSTNPNGVVLLFSR